MFLDSNIIIYASKPEYPEITRFAQERGKSVSAISYVETLGYHNLTETDKQVLETIFARLAIYAVTQDVIEQATKLRQQKKMSLGDAIIAATCLVYNETLATRNTADFDWISGLTLYNPFDAPAQTAND